MSEHSQDHTSGPERNGSATPWFRISLAVGGLVLLLFVPPRFLKSTKPAKNMVEGISRVLVPDTAKEKDKKGIAVCERQAQDLQELVEELRYILSRRRYQRRHRLIGAEVRLRDFYEKYWTGDILIGAGEAQGVAKDMAVVNTEGVVVAKVIETRTNTSVVRLICNLSIPVCVESRMLFGVTTAEQVKTMETGRIAGRRVAMLMPPPMVSVSTLIGKARASHESRPNQPACLEKDDRVTTVRQGNFAEGLLVGEVTGDIERTNSDEPLSARLKTGDMHNLRFLFVVVPAPLPELASVH
jgi:cell shape-determining protein MreC